jgi:hypothetical protein
MRPLRSLRLNLLFWADEIVVDYKTEVSIIEA